jgi:hypothetical protein
MLLRRAHKTEDRIETQLDWNWVSFDRYYYTLASALATVLKTDRAIKQLRWGLALCLRNRKFGRAQERQRSRPPKGYAAATGRTAIDPKAARATVADGRATVPTNRANASPWSARPDLAAGRRARAGTGRRATAGRLARQSAAAAGCRLKPRAGRVCRATSTPIAPAGRPLHGLLYGLCHFGTTRAWPPAGTSPEPGRSGALYPKSLRSGYKSRPWPKFQPASNAAWPGSGPSWPNSGKARNFATGKTAAEARRLRIRARTAARQCPPPPSAALRPLHAPTQPDGQEGPRDVRDGRMVRGSEWSEARTHVDRRRFDAGQRVGCVCFPFGDRSPQCQRRCGCSMVASRRSHPRRLTAPDAGRRRRVASLLAPMRKLTHSFWRISRAKAAGSGLRSFNPNWLFEVARQQNDYLVALIGMLNCISARRLCHNPRVSARRLSRPSTRHRPQLAATATK